MALIDKIRLHYKLEEGGTNHRVDEVIGAAGLELDEQNAGKLVSAGGGVIDNGQDFPGTDEFYYIDGTAIREEHDIGTAVGGPAGITAWTFWFKPNIDTRPMYCVCKWASGTNKSSYRIVYLANALSPTGRMRLELTDGSGTNVLLLDHSEGIVNTSTFSLVYCYVDIPNKTAGMSINNGNLETAGWTTPVPGTSHAQALSVGNDGNSQPNRQVDGVIDELSFWDDKLHTDNDLRDLYNSGSGLAYPFAQPAAAQGFDGSLRAGGGSRLIIPPFIHLD